MYMISLVVLVGAEFNAMLFPRTPVDRRLVAVPDKREVVL
jgi:uncharacterized BrkB/YihY/UPF0761 family membrane protein